MNPWIELKKTCPLLMITLLLAFGLIPLGKAVVPSPDGGYPNFTTAEGTKALQSLTSGPANTAVGWFSLFSNTEGSFNTGVGAATLLFNIGDQTMGEGIENTAIGAAALLFNGIGSDDTAVGTAALLNNSTGTFNTAIGGHALEADTTGDANTATGASALQNNIAGLDNTAAGVNALLSTTTGNNNTAVGVSALFNNPAGSSNIALGGLAGQSVTTASHVICIGDPGQDVSNSCYIGQIFGQTSAGGVPVIINTNHKLGTTTSSKRFKENIQPMDKTSEALFSLKPVSFRYKKEIDPAGTSQLGLVAEDVEKVNSDLVVRDEEGKPYTVRYDQVNAMLLNEFLKEHRTVEQQRKHFEAALAQQQKQIEALTAGLQKVSARIEASKGAPQVASDNE